CRNRALRVRLLPENAEAEQDSDDRAVCERPMDVRFYEPPVMYHREHASEIDQTVQLIPAAAAETADHAGSRRHCQRHHRRPRAEADGNERSLVDVSA